MSECNGSFRSKSWSSFLFLVLDFWLAWSFLSTCLLDTDTGQESVPHRSSLALVSLSLDTVVVCEVDELEEDVERSISCLDGVMGVEEGNLEEELVDKPGTTIRTKFSVLHCVRIPLKLNVVFDR